MLRGRAGLAIGVIIIAVAALVARQLFGTAWSNHCDPGNAQFNLLKSEPVVAYRAQGETFTWENDGPDNSWLCSSPTLSVSHFGDTAALYGETKADMVDSHWTELTSASQADVAVYQKDTAGRVRLTAVVRKQLLWVEVDLDAPGLHPGENGWT